MAKDVHQCLPGLRVRFSNAKFCQTPKNPQNNLQYIITESLNMRSWKPTMSGFFCTYKITINRLSKYLLGALLSKD